MSPLNRLWQRLRNRLARQGGFTLVEMLVVIAIGGGISLAIGAAFIVGAQTSAQANTRLNESTDTQVLTTYFQADGASTFKARGAGNFPSNDCSAGVTGTTVAILDWSDTVGAVTVNKSAYYVRPAASARYPEGPKNLVRRYCEQLGVAGLWQPKATATVMRNLDTATLTCSKPDGTDGPCLNTTLPARIRLDLKAISGYSYSLRSLSRSTTALQIKDQAPKVASIERALPNPTNDASVSWTVTFTEPVKSVNASNFKLTPAGGTLTLDHTFSTLPYQVWTATATTGNIPTTGTLRLDIINAGAIVDSAVPGKALTGTFPFVGQVYDIDKVAPTLALTAPAASGSEPIHFTATFNEAVTGFDQSDVTLGGTAGGAAAGTKVVTGGPSVYDIAVSALTSDGTVTASVGAATVTDLAGNANAAAANASTIYDTHVPTVVSINRVTATPTNAGTLTWTVNFSEMVKGVDVADFVLAKAGIGGTSAVTAVSPSITTMATTFTVTASTGTGSGTLGLNLGDNNSIIDQASKALGGASAGDGNFTGQVYDIDRTAPTVAITAPAVSGSEPVHFTATFSEPISGFAAGDVTLGGNAAGAPGATVTGGPQVYDIAVSGLSSDGTVTASVAAAKVTDLAGNANTVSNTATTVFETDLPTVVSINRVGANPINTTSLSWTVTFSEPVIGVNAGDFALVNLGLGGAPAITAVTPSATTLATVFTVTASTGSGTGTLGLNVVDNDSIVDQKPTTPNKLGGTGAGNGNFTGQVYSVDRVAPSIGSVVLQNKAGGTQGRIEQGDQIIVTYSERMDVSDFCSTWTDDTANQSLSGITVQIDNGGGAGSNDAVLVSGGSGCAFNFGSVDLGNSGFVSTDRNFTGSTATWDQANARLTITLGTTSGTNATVGNTTATYTAGALTDPAGNALTPNTKATGSVRQF